MLLTDWQLERIASYPEVPQDLPLKDTGTTWVFLFHSVFLINLIYHLVTQLISSFSINRGEHWHFLEFVL